MPDVESRIITTSMIEYRSIIENDLEKIANMVCTWLWKDANLLHGGKRQAFLEYITSSYLSRCNYGEVADIDGEVVGFIIGRCDSTFNSSDVACYERSVDRNIRCLKGSFMGNVIADYVERIKMNDEKMLESHKGEFDGELVGLIVDEEHRGEGIGRELLKHFRTYLQANGSKKYYVLTDSYCDVGFYINAGYKEEESSKVRAIFRSGSFFVYSDRIANDD